MALRVALVFSFCLVGLIGCPLEHSSPCFSSFLHLNHSVSLLPLVFLPFLRLNLSLTPVAHPGCSPVSPTHSVLSFQSLFLLLFEPLHDIHLRSGLVVDGREYLQQQKEKAGRKRRSVWVMVSGYSVKNATFQCKYFANNGALNSISKPRPVRPVLCTSPPVSYR